MTSRIAILPEEVASKIAAGEVVERPASVVKELVENSIDAGATEISVHAEAGGRKEIAVIDNGCGMNRDEVLVALERHATSKISKLSDLDRIVTLGFRGEALPSIAAISHMTIETRTADEDVGTRVEIEGGKVGKVSDSGCPVGTKIVIGNLFFNLPARLKFLRSPEVEWRNIDDALTLLALANSQVGFEAYHNKKRQFKMVPGTKKTEPGTILSRISDVLGGEIAQYLYEIQDGRGEIKVSGYVSRPDVTAVSGKGIYLFVNGRPVRDRVVQHAIMQGYHGLLMQRRYPWAVLFLDLPPHLVDVNVHPAKSEVRFAPACGIHDLVASAVSKTLGLGPARGIPSPLMGEGEGGGGSKFDVALPLDSPPHPFDFAQGRPNPLPKWEREVYKQVEFGKTPFSSLKVVGQIKNTYVVCDAADKMILIDQHAAHERIGFEKLRREYRNSLSSGWGTGHPGLLRSRAGKKRDLSPDCSGDSPLVKSQRLLIPESFDLKPSDAEILKKYLKDLLKVGLEIEFFGGNTFVVKAVPVILSPSPLPSPQRGEGVISKDSSPFGERIKVRGGISDLIHDLIEEMAEGNKLHSLDEKIDVVLERIACHRQVRGGDRLSNEEIYALLKELDGVDFSYNCPHGRPVMVEVAYSEIEKWFKRRV